MIVKRQKQFIFSLVLVISFILSPIARAEDNFNPNYIISDGEILDYDSMSYEEIDGFLKNKNGYLATYSAPDPDGKVMTAAQIIFDRATTNRVNPKFLIVLLQKEMGLIEDKSPKQSQLDWATGYGCFDGQACNSRWQGFWKQVNSASLQFRDYMDNPRLYTYKAGNTYSFTNPYSDQPAVDVTPVNTATAALYNYTPHVYNGNYNFYKIWQRYFTRSYPNGSLLQGEGEVGIWLIQGGKKRPFLSSAAFSTRFDKNKVIIVNKADLDKYLVGDPIKFSQYSLVRSPDGSIYLLVDDKRRKLASQEAFRQIGYNPEEVDDVSFEDISYYIEGEPITASSTYATGALLQNKKTGGVYWVSEGKKAPIWDAVFLKTKFKKNKVIAVTPEELDKYPTTDPVVYGDGELVKSPLSTAVYLIYDGKKHPILSGKVFEDMGYKWENIITVSPKVLYLYAEGEVLTNEL